MKKDDLSAKISLPGKTGMTALGRACLTAGAAFMRALNENAVRTEEALKLADRGEFKAAEELMRRNYSNSMEVQRVIGRDAALEEDADMQLGNSRSMNASSYSRRGRKSMKTRSFQLMNQQSK